MSLRKLFREGDQDRSMQLMKGFIVARPSFAEVGYHEAWVFDLVAWYD